MRIAIIGAGGTGGYFGGLPARAGEEVSFLARGTQLEALRTRGLTVKSRLAGTFSLPVHATSDPQEIGAVDLVLFSVKTYDTSAASLGLHFLMGVLATSDIQREKWEVTSSIILSCDLQNSYEVKIGRRSLLLQPEPPVPESIHVPCLVHGAPKMTSNCMVMHRGRFSAQASGSHFFSYLAEFMHYVDSHDASRPGSGRR